MTIHELNTLYNTFFKLQTPLAYRQFIAGIQQIKSEGYRFVMQNTLGNTQLHSPLKEQLHLKLEAIQSEKEEALSSENYETAARIRDEELQLLKKLEEHGNASLPTFSISEKDTKTILFAPNHDNLVNTILSDLITHI